MEAHFWDWLHHGGAMLPRASHPLVHPAPPPDPAAPAAAAAQGQGPAPAAGAQGQPAAGAQGENANGDAPPPGVLMVDLLGAPGTRWGLGTRLAQAVFAAAAVASMASTDDFRVVTAFRCVRAPSSFLPSRSTATAPSGCHFSFAPRAEQSRSISPWNGCSVRWDFPVVLCARLQGFSLWLCASGMTAYYLLVAAASLQCLWSLALGAVDIYALLVKRAFRSPRATTIYSIGDWVTGALTFAAASGSAGITILLDDDLMMCSENHCPSFMAATAMAFFSWFAIAPSCLFNLMMAVYRVQRA